LLEPAGFFDWLAPRAGAWARVRGAVAFLARTAVFFAVRRAFRAGRLAADRFGLAEGLAALARPFGLAVEMAAFLAAVRRRLLPLRAAKRLFAGVRLRAPADLRPAACFLTIAV